LVLEVAYLLYNSIVEILNYPQFTHINERAKLAETILTKRFHTTLVR